MQDDRAPLTNFGNANLSSKTALPPGTSIHLEDKPTPEHAPSRVQVTIAGHAPAINLRARREEQVSRTRSTSASRMRVAFSEITVKLMATITMADEISRKAAAAIVDLENGKPGVGQHGLDYRPLGEHRALSMGEVKVAVPFGNGKYCSERNIL